VLTFRDPADAMVVLGHGCEPSCAKDGSHVLRTQIWAEELRLLPVSVKQKPQMTRDLKAFMHACMVYLPRKLFGLCGLPRLPEGAA